MNFSSLMVRIGAELSGFTKGLDEGEKAAQKWASKMQSAGQSMTAGLTVPIAAMGGVALKSAIDFESAFANVKKALPADTDFKPLSDGIRAMAKEIPETATNLANIAAIGGQFGVSTPALLGFTRTVADLGVAIDGISAESAAQAMAQIAGVTGTAESEFRNMGSTLVDLGNKGKSTEGQILEFTQRLSGAGASVGMSAAEIMGLGAAMANLGINAEAGGSAMSITISKIERAVAMGGEKLQSFAKTAGVSAQQFAATFKGEPAKAMEMFIDGLGRAKDSGQSLTLVLDELGIKDVRQTDALKRLAQSQGEVTKQINIAKAAWESNSALTHEAGEKYKTTANQLVLLKNRATDAGITVGNVFSAQLMDATDASGGLIGKLEGLANGFAALSPGWQKAITYTGLFLAGIGPITWAVGSMVGALTSLTGVLITVGGGIGAATGFVASLSAALGGAGLIALFGALAYGVYGTVKAFGDLYSAWKNGQSMWDFFSARDDDNFVRRFLGLSVSAKEAAAAFKNIPPVAQATTNSLGLTAEQAAHAQQALQALQTQAPQTGAGLNTVSEGAKAAAEEFKKLTDSLSGKELFKEADNLVRAVGAIGGVSQLTADEAERMGNTLGEAIDKYKQRLMAVPPELEKLHTQLTSMPALLLKVEANKDAAARDVAALRDSMQTWLSNRPMNVLIQPSTKGIDLSKMLEPFKKGVVSGLSKPGWLDKAFGGMAAQLPGVIMGAIQGGGGVGKSIGGLLGGGLAKGLGEKAGKAIGGTLGGVLGSVIPGLGTLAGGMLGQFAGQAAGKAVGWITGLFSNPMKKEIAAANAEIGKLKDGLIAHAGDLEHLEAAYNAMGLSIREAFAGSGKQGLETLKAAMAEFKQRTADAQIELDGLKGKLTDATGELKGLLSEAQNMGYIFNESGEFVGVTMQAMSTAAKEFGVDLGALGPVFQQQSLDAEAAKVINAFTLMTKGGADVGGVLLGMKDEIGHVVGESIKFGTTIPANMKPWVEELIRTGQLTDDQGRKINDLTGIKFGAPVATEYEKIASKISEVLGVMADLAAKIGELASSIAAATQPRTINIGWNVAPPPDIPDVGGGNFAWPTQDYPAMATGGVVVGPTFGLVGEAGPEAVLPLDRLQGMLDLTAGGGSDEVVDRLASLEDKFEQLPYVLARALAGQLMTKV